MPRVLIIGNAGAARECYWILQDLLESSPGLKTYYQFGGFLSWHGHESNLKELAAWFRGDLSDYAVDPAELYVIGIGRPDLRRDVFRKLKECGAQLMNLIHPWTAISPSATLGEGNIFQRGCTIHANAIVGDGNYINGAANISHDASIGDFNFLAPFSIVLGGAVIGSLNHLGPHSVVLENVCIGNHNIIGPGSILYKGCKDDCILAGNAALKVGSTGKNDD